MVRFPRCSFESLARLRGGETWPGSGWRARIRTWNKGSKDPDTISPPANGKYRSDRRADAGMVSAFAGGSIPASSRRPVVDTGGRHAARTAVSASGAGDGIPLVAQGVLHPGENVRSPSLRVTSESSDAASCSKSLRCSDVSFFGVTTWTVTIWSPRSVPDRRRAPPLQAELLTALSPSGAGTRLAHRWSRPPARRRVPPAPR